ncbi:hypothetical protein [Epilithonimonas sp.]|uniref:hypothetical protein n=1 Tax=Epilithonimonas sp. TaxID=2894511 RepID=UPI0028971F84|nr:hypothetical protein [Epilithonimonas sp.]
MRYSVIILFLSFNAFVYGQCVCERYDKGIEFIKKDFIDKGIEKYYNDILKPGAYGISIYESFFPLYKSDNYYNWINIDKTKAIEKSNCLSKINKKYWEKNWKPENYYKNKTVFSKDKFKGPSHIAIFTEIRNDSLRVDVISNSSEGLRSCGSINKYLLIFDNKNNIKETKSWTAHYECL